MKCAGPKIANPIICVSPLNDGSASAPLGFVVRLCALQRVTCCSSAPVHAVVVISSSIHPSLSLSLFLSFFFFFIREPLPALTSPVGEVWWWWWRGNGVLPLLYTFTREILFSPHPPAQSCASHPSDAQRRHEEL